LSWKVTVDQYSIDELGEILDAKGGQFFESIADDEVLTRGFIRRNVGNYCSRFGSFETVDRGFELERGFQ
jgi:hypothetical protein